MKSILKKLIVILLIICILIPSLFSGFVLADGVLLTQERAGNYAANFAINFYDNWSSISFEVVNGGSQNGVVSKSSVLVAGQKIYSNLMGRTDVVYASGAGGASSDTIVNHPEKLTAMDCTAFVSAALWAAGYDKFATQHGSSGMYANCSDGTYASYGLEIYRNDSNVTKRWNGSEFVADPTLKSGTDFLQPGDVVVQYNLSRGGSTHHANIVIEKENETHYKALDCGIDRWNPNSSSYRPEGYVLSNLWTMDGGKWGSYVIRAPGGGVVSSSNSSSSSSSKESYGLPIASMANGSISSNFGSYRSASDPFHMGTDIIDSWNAPIYASHSGTVVAAYNTCNHHNQAGSCSCNRGTRIWWIW